MKRPLLKKFVLAAFCLLGLPAAALADGVVIGSCGNAPIMGAANPVFGPCPLPGGGSALQGAQAISGVNSFQNIHSPVVVLGGLGQVNVFTMTIISTPIWTGPGPVPTVLSLDGAVTILVPGASVDIQFTGLLGGPPLSISLNTNQDLVFSVTEIGDQAIAATAVSTLTITITGAALVVLPASGQFAGAIPEPTTMLLLGTGLAGIAIKTRRRLRSRKSGT